MPVTEQTFKAVALEDPEGHWEPHRGRLREKPAMSESHQEAGVLLGYSLLNQLDWNEYRVRVDSSRVRRPDET